jgi:hypothetical protein
MHLITCEKLTKANIMNALDNLLLANKKYKKLVRIERQLIKSAVNDYQIEELVKQCSKAKLTRDNQLVSLLQTQCLGSLTLVGFSAIPYLTLMAF